MIAEIGCNQKSDMEIAKKMIKIAAQFCNIGIKKLQKRNPKELLTPMWDITLTKEIATLKPDIIKIQSTCNLNFDMLNFLFKKYDRDIHISSMKAEEEHIKNIGEC